MFRNSENIIHRPDSSTMYEEEPSLGHLIAKNLTAAGDKTMLVCGITGEKLSAIELLNKSIEYAEALQAAGVKPGDVVSIISENRFEFTFVLFGTIMLNCALAPLNNTYAEKEIEHAMKISRAKIIFAGGEMRSRVLRVVKRLKFVEKVVLLDGGGDGKLEVSLNNFLDSVIRGKINFQLEAVDRRKTVCLIMCSSGTTGLPKGVQISQMNLIVTIRNSVLGDDSMLGRNNVGDGEIVILGLLPMFHVFGCSVLIFTMASAAGKIVLLPKFNEETFLGSIQKYKCTVLFIAPPTMVFLDKDEIVDNYDLSSLRLILCGAAPLSKELELSVANRLKNPKLVTKQGYGMSELTVCVLAQKSIVKAGSVGDVNSGVFAKVVGEDGKALGPKQTGELCFKGSVLMMGYLGDDQATKATIDEDGWLHTGDIGYYDEELQFFIVDRIKELIKWKGFQVAPAELEALLLTHPNIKDCGVIGKPDEKTGEAPIAFVVKDDSALSENDIMDFIAGLVSYAKRLHGGVIFVDEIPKNPSGKILRRTLREMLKIIPKL